MSVRERFNIAKLALASILVVPCVAHAQDTLAIIGASKLSLPDQSPTVTRTADTIAVPVSIPATSLRALPRVRVRQLQWNGRQLSTRAVGFTLVIDSTGSPGLPIATLNAVLDSSIATHAGEHTVLLEVLWPGAGNAPARSQLLTLVFVAPTAELRTSGARRIEHTWYPFFSRSTPRALLLDETGRRAALVPMQTERRADLVATDGTPTGSRIRVTLPARIAPNGQELAPVHVEGTPPLGKSTATIRISAPGLATEATDVAIEVVTRPTILLILLVITLGVVAGYNVRVRMERRRLRHLADATVNREVADAADVARAIKDPDFKARLVEVTRVLDLVRQDPSATPEALQAAIQKAIADRTAIVTEMNALNQSLAQDLNGWLEALGAPGNYAGKLGKDVEKVREQFRGMSERANAGMLIVTRKTLDATLPALKTALSNAVGEWQTSLQHDLSSVGEWPESDYAQAVAGLSARAQAMAAAATPGATREVFHEQLLAAGQASRMQWQVVTQYAIPRLMTQVQALHDDFTVLARRLDDKDDADDDGDIEAFTTALEHMQAALDEARDAHGKVDPDAPSIVGVGDALRAAKKQAIQAATIALRHVPDTERARIQGQLDANQLTAAAVSLAEHVPAPKAGSATRRTRGRIRTHAAGVTPHSRAPQDGAQLPIVGAVMPGLSLQWNLPDGALTGVPAAISISALLNGAALVLPSIQWKVDGVDAGSANQPTLLLTVERPGNVVVEAHVRDASSTHSIVDRRTILIGPSPRESAKLQFKAAEQIEARQTVVYGALIVVMGALIFAPLELSWAQVVFLPLLWGFTTDVGLARVRELAAPVSAKALPT